MATKRTDKNNIRFHYPTIADQLYNFKFASSNISSKGQEEIYPKSTPVKKDPLLRLVGTLERIGDAVRVIPEKLAQVEEVFAEINKKECEMLKIENRTIFENDNLFVLRGIESNSIDLIYLDPPFNTNRIFALTDSAETSEKEVAFEDIWTLTTEDRIWHAELIDNYPDLFYTLETAGRIYNKEMKAYLIMLSMRLLQMQRILKHTGSIYLHCDPTASHYIKLVMDTIFGKQNFRNEIIWRIGWISGYKSQAKSWIRNHDTILYYAFKEAAEKFNKQYIPYEKDYTRRDGSKPIGKGIAIEDTWNCSDKDILDSIQLKSFSTEKTGYPTQKPLALLERIIKASSNPGDIVLDPFCGSGTTLIAAENLGRKWIGIDKNNKAIEILMKRFEDEFGLFKDSIINRSL